MTLKYRRNGTHASEHDTHKYMWELVWFIQITRVKLEAYDGNINILIDLWKNRFHFEWDELLYRKLFLN